jgi:uncharacterized circularly permuted ATP-grasp superfamily protein
MEMKLFKFKLRLSPALLIAFGVFYFETSVYAGVQNGDRCYSFYGNGSSSVAVAGFFKTASASSAADRIPVRGSDGIFQLASDHPFIYKVNGEFILRPNVAELGTLVMSRSPEIQHELNQRATSVLGAYFGMGFKTKDGRPFDVRLNAIPVTVNKTVVDSIAKGMEPTLQKMREILQVFLSNPSAPVEAYQFKNIDRKEVEQIIKDLKESPYYEAAAVHPDLKDYPFGSVFGVDATFGNLGRHLAHIFEINAGTPSGLSNMTMIFETLRRTDPELFKSVAKELSENRAFIVLRETMEAHGKKFLEDGLAVELGTGVYNGAHPDIAMIAHFSGMPLVERSDLFIDREGHVRINKKFPISGDGFYNLNGKKIKHVGGKDYQGYPQISSIYSRSEEGNALQENTSEGRVGVGYKIPKYAEINEKLARKTGLNLAPGTVYAFKYDRVGRVTNVLRDENGNPIVQSSFDQFASDPVFASNTNKSLIRSIHDKKVYLSNFGTRLIDHKGILALVTKEVQLEAIKKGLDPEKTIVSPPPEMRGDVARDVFYKNPRNYVVKVPDESGGVGVYILPTASTKEVKNVMAMVKGNPDRYVIQSIADFMSVVSVSEVNGKKVYVNRANDGRVFLFMGPDGKVVADPWGILVRVADHLKLSTNTSQGAQYGWVRVVDSRGKVYYDFNLPTFPKTQLLLITPQQSYQLVNYLISINMLLNGFLKNNNVLNDQQYFLDIFWLASRHLMPVLGPEYSHVIRAIEDLKAGRIRQVDFLDIIEEVKVKLHSGSLDPIINSEIQKILSESPHFNHFVPSQFQQHNRTQ